jgi:hypothetical protein
VVQLLPFEQVEQPAAQAKQELLIPLSQKPFKHAHEVRSVVFLVVASQMRQTDEEEHVKQK